MRWKKRKKLSIRYKIFFVILSLLVLLVILYPIMNKYFENYGKTLPEEVLNNTHGEFTIKSNNYMSFQEYYLKVKSPKEKNLFADFSNLKFPDPFEIPESSYDYKFYDYDSEYYDYCEGKKIEINFTNFSYSEFQFNYKDKTFNYKINLYSDLYYFSDNLKNQDCYFGKGKYTQGFLEDSYNNNFINAISKNFISLQEKGYMKDEIVEIATLFVQSIPYGTDYTKLNRYPYETLYEKEGNCLDKSLILTGILRNLGYTSYIILGDSDYEYHALVGLVCDKGNINYQGQEICFIEITFFTPISSEIEIDIDEYIQVSEGSLIYSERSYGSSLVGYLDVKLTALENIENNLDSMEFEIEKIKTDICNTDCTNCNVFIMDPYYCDDAYEYNRYVRELNKMIDKYNPVVKIWYEPLYEIEKSMFNNIEMVKRNQITEE